MKAAEFRATAARECDVPGARAALDRMDEEHRAVPLLAVLDGGRARRESIERLARPDELVVGVSYGCRVVVTNPTSAPGARSAQRARAADALSAPPTSSIWTSTGPPSNPSLRSSS